MHVNGINYLNDYTNGSWNKW